MLSKKLDIREVIPLRQKTSILYKSYLAWRLAKAVPDSQYIIATHTPTTLVTLINKFIFHRKGQLIWFYMDYPGMFASRRLEGLLMHFAMLWHEKALTLSLFSKNELISLSSTNKSIHVIGLGLSNKNFYNNLSPKTTIRSHKGIKSILYIGDHRIRKGLFDFLRAAEMLYIRYPNIELWLALKDDCQVPSTLPYKCFHRPTVRLLANLYKTCDLFVSSSWYEGFGLPALEAMACGAPVVLTDSGGVREYANPKINCMIVPPRNPPALSGAMYEVLNNPHIEDELRKNGPLTSARFSWEECMIKIEKAFMEI